MNKLLILATALTVFLGLATAQPLNQTDPTKGSVNPVLVPGDLFYGFEKAVESLEVKLAGAIGGPDLRSKALANNAEERLAEAKKLSDQNKTEEASRLVEEYSRTLNSSKNIARDSNNTQLSEKLDNISRKNVKTLEEVKKKVPVQARDAIQRAIDNSGKPKNMPKIPKAKPQTPGKSGVDRAEIDRSNPTNKTPGNPSSTQKPDTPSKENLSDKIKQTPRENISSNNKSLDKPNENLNTPEKDKTDQNKSEKPRGLENKVRNKTEDLKKDDSMNNRSRDTKQSNQKESLNNSSESLEQNVSDLY